MKHLKIKVCGLTDALNVEKICEIGPDYIGYIFYRKSARYVGDHPSPDIFSCVPNTIQKTAVFVNEYYDRMIEIISRYKIDVVQLHGMESPEICSSIRYKGKKVIKVIPGDQADNHPLFEKYADHVDYFLFDTPVRSFGGSGRKFDWSKLKDLKSNTDFFLSGGISVDDAETLLTIDNKSLYAVDINSRFETEPGIKDPLLVKRFINELRNGK